MKISKYFNLYIRKKDTFIWSNLLEKWFRKNHKISSTRSCIPL